jgi:hypothetical protein
MDTAASTIQHYHYYRLNYFTFYLEGVADILDNMCVTKVGESYSTRWLGMWLLYYIQQFSIYNSYDAICASAA